MPPRDISSTEAQLEIVARLQHRLSQIENTRSMIWSAQTTVCALLVLDAGLTIAEVARVAGIHRATLTRAVKTEEVIRGLKTAEEITLRREQDLRHIANVTDMTRRYD